MSALWDRLHKRALTFKGKDDTSFILQFGKDIPRYTKGCKCNEFWYKLIKQHPPTYGARYFEWSVLVHNLVNAKLGKPKYTVQQARKYYQNKL